MTETQSREPEVRLASPVAEPTEEGKLAQVRREIDAETRQKALQQRDPIAIMKLNIAWANQYPNHEIAKAIKWLGSYWELTTNAETAKEAVSRMIEIQKRLGITDVAQDGIIWRGTIKASEDKAKEKERAEAQKLIEELDQSLYTPDLQKKTEQAKKEKPGVWDVLSTLWNKGGKEAVAVIKDAVRWTVVKDAKGNEYRVGKWAEWQTQYTNNNGDIFEIKDNRMQRIKVSENSDQYKTHLQAQITNTIRDNVMMNANNTNLTVTDMNGKEITIDNNGNIITAPIPPTTTEAPTSAPKPPEKAIDKDKVKFNEATSDQWSTIKSGEKGWKYRKIDGELFAIKDSQTANPQEQVQKLDTDGKWKTVDISTLKASWAVDIFLQQYWEWWEMSNFRTDKFKDIKLRELERIDDHGEVGWQWEKVIGLVEKIAQDLGYETHYALALQNPEIGNMSLSDLRNALSNEDAFISSPLMQKAKRRDFIDPNNYGVSSQYEYAQYDWWITLKRDRWTTDPNKYLVKTDGKYIPIAEFLYDAESNQVDEMAEHLGWKNIPGRRVIRVGGTEIAYWDKS